MSSFLHSVTVAGVPVVRWAVLLVWSGWLGAAGSVSAVELSVDPEDWLVLSGPHFEVYSDAHPEGAAEVLVDLERFRALFARLAPGLDLRSPAPLRMVAFDGPRSFAPYKTRRDGGGTLILGQFHRHSDANYLLLDGRTRTGDDYSVAFHELTHFFVTHNVPQAPLWLNEGLAEYYGTFGVEDERAVVGRAIERHVDLLLLGNEIRDLEGLLETDSRAASSHGPREVGRFYALSWLLVHYLLSQPDGPDRTADYLLRLADGDDPGPAFEAAYDVSLRDLEQELRLYVARGDFALASLPVSDLDPLGLRARRAGPADVLCVLGDFVLNVGAFDYAESHFRAALVLDPGHGSAHAGLATVRSLRGSWQEAELLYRDANRLGVDDPLSFVRYARHSLTRAGENGGGAFEAQPLPDGDADELRLRIDAAARARSALAKAIHDEPHYAVAHQMLAAAHLVAGGDPQEGLEAALAAQRIQPVELTARVLEVLLRLRLAEDVERGVGQADLAEDRIRDLTAYGAEANAVLDLQQRVDVARWLRRSELSLARGETEDALEALDHAVSAAGDPEQRRSLEARLRALRVEVGVE